MPFDLDYRPAAQSFLDELKLNRDGRLRLFHTLHDLRNVPDEERADPTKRMGSFFEFRRAFRYDRRLLPIRLLVDDGSAQYGILRIVYADQPIA